MISVIIPTYNTAPLILRAVQSVREQSGNFEIEILVVDDKSTDDTLAVLEAIGDPRIKIFQQQINQGPAAARNRGIREASGEYCAFLDGDDYWNPEFLRKTVTFLEHHPEAVAVSVGQVHKIIGKTDTIVPSITDDDINQNGILLDDFYLFWAKHNHVCTGSVLMRTKIVRETGGQRENLRICEDLEFWALLATYGKWGIIPCLLFVSDGGVVTRQQGWLQKNIVRWQSAVPVEEWNRRIIARISATQLPSYRLAEGKIAYNICYSMIMSGRYHKAYEIVKQYRQYFQPGKAKMCFCTAGINYALWCVFCYILKNYEYKRKIN